MKIDPNEPAFPTSDTTYQQRGETYTDHGKSGLTIRAHFAALAMQGYLANAHGMMTAAKAGMSVQEFEAVCASDAVRMADELIKALNK